jgi:hypothetical protein
MKRFWVILLPFFLLMPTLPLFSSSLVQNHIPTISSTQCYDAAQTGYSPSNSTHYGYGTPEKLLACATFRFPENSLREELSFLDFLSGQGGSPTGSWGKGSFDSALDSAKQHFRKHGAEVGAKDLAQYIRKAEEFARNLRGATKQAVEGFTNGVTRYMKNWKYVDLAPDGSIISFGKL